MPEVAGSVVISIGGDLTAFEVALAKAKEQAVAFDAQISAQLNGAGVSEGLARIAAGVDTTNALLTKLTTTGTAASAVMSKIATSTTATTAALTKVATATKLVNAEMASIGGSGGGAAALGATTIAAKDFAAALEATGGNLSKITPAMLGIAVANEEIAVSSKAAAVGMTELGVAETEAAGLGAGVSREFSVLGSEVLRGNFSRIPGSLLVMNERLAATGAGVLTLGNGMKALGALGSVIFNPFVLGFLAITIGSEVAIKAFKSIGGSVEDVNTILKNHKDLVDEITGAYPEAAAAAKKYEEQAKQLPQSVVASDAADRIKADQAALDKSMGGILNTLRLAQASSDAVGTAGADAFGHIADEIEAGSLHAEDLARNLVSLKIDPALSETAKSIAQDLIGASKEALTFQNTLEADKGLKSIGPDGQKAQKSLFDVSTGFKDVGSNAGSADATIAKLFGTMNSGGGSGYGVTKSLAGQFGGQLTGQLQSTLGLFEQVDAAVQNARQNQLAGMTQLEAQFRATTTRVEELKTAIATAGSNDNIKQFFGDVSNIKNANDEIANATTKVTQLFAEMAAGSKSVSAVDDGLQAVRQTLINDGFPVDKVDQFLQRLRQVNQELVSDQGQVHQLGAAVQALKDKTVTITVVTRQVGTGQQSIYDVPNSSGGTSSVGVTGYGGTSNMTQSTYQVPSDISGGMVDTSAGAGDTGVTVTRFGGTRAAGGPVTANMPYWVGEHGPELVVPSSAGSVVPNGQSTALANPQSGFNGQDPTADNTRYFTLLMNIEANTQKTAQLLDEIHAAGASSGLSSGSSSSSSSTTGTTTLTAAQQLDQQYADNLANIKANFAAAGIVGGGSIGYGSDGLGATPEQIAANITYGGVAPVGNPTSTTSSDSNAPQFLQGGQSYPQLANLNPGSQAYAKEYATLLAAQNKQLGFDTGGVIAPGDSQKVEFFKNPNERVIIARPDQFTDTRSQPSTPAAPADNRPITINQVHNWNGNAPPSQASMNATRQATAMGIRDAMRALNGR